MIGQHLIQVGFRSFAVATLGFALLLYGALCVPFPRAPGWRDALVGGLLVIATLWVVFFARQLALGSIGKDLALFYRITAGFFVYLLTVPFVGAIASSWGAVDIFRDVVPLVFGGMFLLFSRHVAIKFEWIQILSWALALCGLSMSLRYIVFTGVDIGQVGVVYYDDRGAYFGYDPSVIFSVGFFFCMAIRAFGRSRFLSAICFFALGLVAIISVVAVIQRAQVVFVVFVVSVYAAYTLKRSVLAYLVALPLITFFAIEILQNYSNVYEAFVAKFEDQGARGKSTELAAIMQSSSQSVPRFMFGLGWGAKIENPVYAQGYSTATHSLITYYFAKAGLVGFLGALWMVWFGVRAAFSVIRSGEGVLVLASCITPIAIGVLFQPSYKTFTFGVSFLLLVSCGMFADKSLRTREKDARSK